MSFGDDRITCATCRHCARDSSWCRTFELKTNRDLPRRCLRYAPLHGERDQRTGAERFEAMPKAIEEARAADNEFHQQAGARV